MTRCNMRSMFDLTLFVEGTKGLMAAYGYSTWTP
jgi:hypothetical protein